MSNNNDMKTEVIIPGNGKNAEIFLIVYKELIAHITKGPGICAPTSTFSNRNVTFSDIGSSAVPWSKFLCYHILKLMGC